MSDGMGLIVQNVTPTGVRTMDSVSVALAAQAKATIEARYLVAMRYPRNLLVTRERLLDACRRPVFAEKARYAVPRGGSKVRGWTIRFAEDVARALGNLSVEASAIHDDEQIRIVRVTVTDLEANIPWSIDVTIAKVVERNSVKEGAVVMGERIGSQGQRVFLIAATDDDLMVKQNALVSKAARTGILRSCPADILEECEVQVQATNAGKLTKDRGGEIKKLVDAFAGRRVSIGQLDTFLGHPVTDVSGEEWQLLREMFAAMSEEGVMWSQLHRDFSPAERAESETRVGVEAVKQKLASRAARAPVAEPAAAVPVAVPADTMPSLADDDGEFDDA